MSKKTEDMAHVIWSAGPDKLMPAESHFSSKLNQPVKLRLGELDAVKYPPVSLYTIFKRTVDARPDHDALCFKSDDLDGPWLRFSYLEYWKMCNKAAKSFIKMNLEISECVAIVGFNSPQWFIAQMGAIFAGGIGCGMYTTNSAEQNEIILRDSKAKIVVVENKQQLDKIIKCKENNCNVQRIIQYSGKPENTYGGLVMSWQEFIDYGIDVNDTALELRVKSIAPNKCATLIYTSGTTGTPKAAMVSHDCVAYLTRYLGIDVVGLRQYSERIVSYLPLSHIAAQAVDIYISLNTGATVYFAQPDALKGSLPKTLKEARPTFFFGVPRVWEKMQESIEKVVQNLSGAKLNLFNWARKVASKHINAQFLGGRAGGFDPAYSLAKLLVLGNIHKQLGLDQCRTTISGAAPIARETLDFFIALGLPLCETFGMSESTGPHIVGTPTANRVCSVGRIAQFNRSKLINKDADESGELCVYGRHVYMGYLNDEAKTRETFDADGWLRTGDISKITDNYMFITGRLKELIITAGGENIAPVPIENNLKAELPSLISNAMLIGDKRKYLCILITLKSNVDLDSMLPLDTLTSDCVRYLKSIGSNSTTVSDVINKNDEIVFKTIENGIKSINKKAVSRASVVQKFKILPRDFSLPSGELGPTLKLRRPMIVKLYSQVIEDLYKDANNNDQ